MPALKLPVVLCCLLCQTALASADQPGSWQNVPGVTSAKLATIDGTTLEASSGLSWPDGRQAIVAFWKTKEGLRLRCTTMFNASMQFTGELCAQAMK